MPKERSKLPDGWRWVRLGEVCEQDRRIVEPGSDLAERLPYLSLQHVESKTGRILRQPTETIQDEGKSTTFAFDPRHVLYGKLRPYLNKVALPDFDGRCTTEIIPLLPENETDRHYLAWLLRTDETVNAAMRQRTGSRMPRADMDDLLTLEVPKPPLEEQKRIAAILNEQMGAVERARAAAEAQLEAAKALPAAYLRQVFPQSGQELPAGWHWVRLGEVCEINPRRPELARKDDSLTTFVPMSAVDERLGTIVRAETKPFGQVRKGYTYFEDCDVLFAKITPCMQNGKHAIARNLVGGFGFGTTEFHVLRRGPAVIPDWIHFFIRQPEVLENAKAHFTGAVGQQRVPETYLAELEISLPPVDEQKRIAAMLNEQMASAERARKAIEEELDGINKLPAALLRRAFNGEL
jgi:type I restriction enzyme S subunit